ncbi:ribonuclease J [Candidatus Phytoplasma australiense]|uniref:Ribonuclease J n=1 Tax=Strawberry lethal yellows phytoplasma (CPA) str. NZSb11 TaxID=980422 RepID=R4RNE3_PHYAS|nr:ribonuclease J [Candidatus Phytoplasma australiense]AGL89941.1 Metallo-Beta-Lactamase Family Protein [Strawberry lethal yellows phytoplasma (CPA) str. NZSb11]
MNNVTSNIDLNKLDVSFFALGGLGEVGKNMYVFEIGKEIFIVDSGFSFSENFLLGINYVIPDYQYLRDNESRIVGLFITHGHEDHIGGIPYLLKKVHIPKIFVSGIAYHLLRYKLLEHKDVGALPPMVNYNADSCYHFQNASISFIRVNHSIPDTFGIVIKTKYGNLFYTSDFKIDYTPVGPPAEYEKLIKIRQEGVLCLLSDSTNAEQEGVVKSESTIGHSIDELFVQIPDRIIIVTFASNFYRIKQIVEATILTKRKIAVFGRSMKKSLEIGQKNGYLNIPEGTLVPSHNIHKYRDIILLCTGSQGEPLAALSRMANNSHRQIKLNYKDTIIFSSSPIPGNQENINKTLDLLLQKNVNVITHGPLINTHVSGHGNQNDLKLMLTLIQPKYFIPVHGERRMLQAHKNLAVECNISEENIFILDNGQRISLIPDEAHIVNTIPMEDVFLDASGMNYLGNSILQERRFLSQEGLFAVVMSIDVKKKQILSSPTIVSRGFIYMKSNQELIKKISLDIKNSIEKAIKNNEVDKEVLKKIIIDYLFTKIYQMTFRKPIIIPIILTI